jgi:hypothetical protein
MVQVTSCKTAFLKNEAWGDSLAVWVALLSRSKSFCQAVAMRCYVAMLRSKMLREKGARSPSKGACIHCYSIKESQSSFSLLSILFLILSHMLYMKHIHRWRGSKPRNNFKAIRNAAICIQSVHRMIAAKYMLVIKKKERKQDIAIETRMSVIQQTFDCAGSVQGSVFSVDEGLLDEVET